MPLGSEVSALHLYPFHIEVPLGQIPHHNINNHNNNFRYINIHSQSFSPKKTIIILRSTVSTINIYIIIITLSKNEIVISVAWPLENTINKFTQNINHLQKYIVKVLKENNMGFCCCVQAVP